MKLLWLDDERNPDSDFLEDIQCSIEDVTICKNYSEFVKSIQLNGLPDWISFDYYLQDEKTGYDCASWLVDYCHETKQNIPKYNIHSFSSEGRIMIYNKLEFGV